MSITSTLRPEGQRAGGKPSVPTAQGAAPLPQPRGSRATGAQPLKADAAVGRHGLTHVHGRPPCRLMAGWVIRPVGSILVVERRTDLRPWEQMWGGRLGSQGPGWRRTRRLRGAPGPALAPGTSCLPGPGRGRARPGASTPGSRARGWCSLRKRWG